MSFNYILRFNFEDIGDGVPSGGEKKFKFN